MHEIYNLYLMLLCQLGQLSQWPVFNRPTQLTQRTQRTQPFIFVFNAEAELPANSPPPFEQLARMHAL
jgi:hypothetical protein